MNFAALLDDVKLFKALVIESGFRRDVADYIASIPSNEDNIIALREMATNVRDVLDDILGGDLPNALSKIFPSSEITPFTQTSTLDGLNSLLEDKEISQDQFHTDLNNILAALLSLLDKNHQNIDQIENFLRPYCDYQQVVVSPKKAIVSVIFKDEKTTGSLDEFIKTLKFWNRTLLVYHQMLSSSSPPDIEIVEVQNGSIDLLITLDINVAINLTELFTIGFQCFAAYLSYKGLLKPLAETYYGNKKLLQLDREREKHLLDNVKVALVDQAKKQSKSAREKDKKIPANISKPAKEVGLLISNHIVNGNDFKLLTHVDDEAALTDEEEIQEGRKRQLRKVSSEARVAREKLSVKDKQKLIAKYSRPEESDGDD